jgi:IS605 OrfB family transposase
MTLFEPSHELASARPVLQGGDSEPILLVLKFRLRDKHARELNRQARSVHYVWNYANETQQKAAKSGRRWLTAVDLQRLTAGAGKWLDLHAHTIQKVCQQYDRSRKQHKKAWLRFRGRKSLGWVPFNQGHVTFDGVAFKFRGIKYQPMHLRDIPAGSVIHAGSFNADTKGHWYINVPVEFPAEAFAKSGAAAVGIDLGLKELATLSTGEKIAAPQHYRRLQEKLGKAQRANKKRLACSIATKIANARKDHLHKASARIALAHGLIAVGNVSSSRLSRTRMAKSVLDAGWSTLRTQLSYKAMRHGGRMVEVDERFTSQVCSACGALPEGRPKGIADLGVRRWECSECGAVHDRDVNAALNIARAGLGTLAEGAPL